MRAPSPLALACAAASFLVLVAAPWGCDAGAGAGAGQLDDDDDGSEGEAEQQLEFADAGIPERPEEVVDAGFAPCIPLAPLPPEALPRCTAATRDCVAACPGDQTGEACRNACWANDPTPPLDDGGDGINCNDCVFVQLFTCLAAAGCDQEVNAFLCCALTGAACQNEGVGLFGCGGNNAPECFDVVGGDVGQCYAETDDVVDAGP